MESSRYRSGVAEEGEELVGEETVEAAGDDGLENAGLDDDSVSPRSEVPVEKERKKEEVDGQDRYQVRNGKEVG